ncbi:hypothetical protein GQ457_01G035750 [Hibiscus cannabinus]
MDPNLKGHFPTKAARSVADIAQRCLQKDPSRRPTMRTIVENLKIIQDMKYACLFPLQEPAAVSGKQISRSPSLDGVVTPAPGVTFLTITSIKKPAIGFSDETVCIGIDPSTPSLFLYPLITGT